MKHLVFITISFLFLSCGKSASQNSVTENGKFQIYQDTIIVDIKGELTHALKYQNKFYCLFEQKMIGKFGGYPKRWFYVFSNDGKFENIIDFPEKLHCVYLDFFVKNDSIILNPYMEDESYYLNIKKNKWVKIKKTDDLIFEDENYAVISRDFGEWGGKTWFKDKKTGIEYVTEVTTPLVNKIDTIYFLTNGFEIRRIDNPHKLTKCENYATYENIEEDGTYTYWYSRSIGFEYLFNDTTYDYDYFNFSYHPHIVTSFVYNDSLFQIYETDSVTYLATIDSNKVKSILPIANNLRFFNWHESYRCKNLNGNNELLKFRTKGEKLTGLLEIIENKIYVHYFANKAEVKPKDFGANKADNIFEQRLDFLLLNLGNLSLSKVEEFEQNLTSFDVSPNHSVGIGKSYYPKQNKYQIETCKAFLIKEDSLISNTAEYFYSKDSIVRVAFLEWYETDIRTLSEQTKVEEIFKTKLEMLQKIISKKTATKFQQDESKENYSSQRLTTTNGFTFNLEYMNTFNRIRLVIYKE